MTSTYPDIQITVVPTIARETGAMYYRLALASDTPLDAISAFEITNGGDWFALNPSAVPAHLYDTTLTLGMGVFDADDVAEAKELADDVAAQVAAAVKVGHDQKTGTNFIVAPAVDREGLVAYPFTDVDTYVDAFFTAVLNCLDAIKAAALNALDDQNEGN